MIVAACLMAGGAALLLAADLFTLSWAHSVERVEWQETWRVTPTGLEILEARVKGSGAGMEPPPGAKLEGGWWIYEPELGILPEIRLAASGRTAGGWRLCTDGKCREIGAQSGEPVVLKPCS